MHKVISVADLRIAIAQLDGSTPIAVITEDGEHSAGFVVGEVEDVEELEGAEHLIFLV